MKYLPALISAIMVIWALFMGIELSAVPLETEGLSSSHILNVDNEGDIPQTVLEHFYRDIPLDIPVILNINAGRFSYTLDKLYKEKLLADGYRLFEQEQENSLVWKITYDESTRQSSSGFFIFRKQYQEEQYFFSSQLTKMPESQILSFDNLTLTIVTSPESSNMKWYDPLLISAFIGTLAYLFYFGGN